MSEVINAEWIANRKRASGRNGLDSCNIAESLIEPGLVMIRRPGDTNFYACSSRRRIRLQADVIINRIVKTLLAPEVSLCRLN